MIWLLLDAMLATVVVGTVIVVGVVRAVLHMDEPQRGPR